MIKRLLATSLLASILAIGAGYWSWSYWSPAVLRHILAGYDIELLHAEISRPTFSSISLEHLELRYRDAVLESRVTAPRIAISYQTAELLDGRVVAVVAPQMAIDIELIEAEPEASDTQQALAVFIPEYLFTQTPVEVVQITDFTVHSSKLAQFRYLRGSLGLDHQQLSLTVAGDGPAALQLSFMMNRHNQLSASLKVDAEPALQLTAGATTGNDQHLVAGNLEADLGATARLMELLQWLPPDTGISGQLQADWQLPLPGNGPGATSNSLLLHGQLSGAGEVKLAQLQGLTRFSLDSDFRIGNDRSQIDIRELLLSGIQAAPAALTALSPKFPEHPLQVGFRASPGMQIMIENASDLVTVDSPTAQLSVNHTGAGLNAEVKFNNSKLGFGDSLRSSSEFSASVELDQASAPGYSAEQLKFTAAGTVTAGSGKVTVTPQNPVHFQALNVNLNNYLLPFIKVSSEVKSGIVITDQAATIDLATSTITDQTLMAGALRLTFPHTVIESGNATLPFTEELRIAATFDIAAQRVAVSHDAITLVPINLDASASLAANKLTADFATSNANRLLNIRGKIDHDLDSGGGQLTAAMDSIVFNRRTPYLPRIIHSLRQPIDATAGQFHLTANANWNVEQTALNATIDLVDVAGFYNRNLFSGLNGTLHLYSDDINTRIAAERITVADADVGVPVKNIGFALTPRNNAIVATEFRAELLGGTISQKEFVYDWTRAENQLVINLQDIQLGEVLKLERGVIGSGSLSGQLPITLANAGISIERGDLSARAPGGVLKYDSGTPLTGVAANAGLQLTLDALKNFHYSVLTAQVDYAHSGDLNLKVALQGRNPELKEQRPFLFNLNITENVPALLKSLKLTREISDDLDRRIKAFYNTDQQESPQ